jgi:hypothetical protein
MLHHPIHTSEAKPVLKHLKLIRETLGATKTEAYLIGQATYFSEIQALSSELMGGIDNIISDSCLEVLIDRYEKAMELVDENDDGDFERAYDMAGFNDTPEQPVNLTAASESLSDAAEQFRTMAASLRQQKGE